MYLDIQRERFRDRLLTETKVSDDVLGASVPYLLLQPLVENAIKHGVAKRPGTGKVEISISKNADNLQISVMNENGCSYDAPAHDGMGIGLENTRSRLRILYDSRSQFLAHVLADGRFQVSIEFPFELDARGDVRFPAALEPVMETSQ